MLEKKWIQHSIALLTFLLVSVIFCKPALEGKILIASDNLQTIGSLKEADDFIKNTDATVAGWTGTMFSGMPVFRSHFPNKLIATVYMLQQGEHAHSWDVLLWLMVSFYVFGLALGVSSWVALLFSVGYAFTAFNIMSMEHGHFFKIFASAMVPGTLGGAILLMRGKYLGGAIAFILFLNLLVGINHTQITYYAMLASLVTVVAYGVHLALAGKVKQLIPAAGIMAAALALAVTANIGILHNASTAEATIRGGSSELSARQNQGSGLDKDYASSWSMDIIETYTYFIPNFAGGPSSNYFVQDRESNTYRALMQNRPENANQLAQQSSAYWGNQPFVGGGFYMGAVFCFLFLLYLAIGKDFKRFWLGALFAIILLFAWGKNFPAFYDLVFNHLPMYNKFRVPSMINLLMQFVIVGGAALSVHALLERGFDKKRLYMAGGALLAALAAFVLLAPSFFSFTSRALAETGGELPSWYELALRKDRIALMQRDGFRAIIFVALAGALIWAWAENKLKNKVALVAGIGVIACFDVIGNAARHVSAEDFVSKRRAYAIFNPTPADAQILADKDPHFRVFNLTRSPFNDAITSYHHKSIGGYHGAKLRRYQELIEGQISRQNRAVLNMLNTKYFIINGEQGPEARANPGALGAAWLVDSLAVVPDADAEMAALNEPFNPARYAVIQQNVFPEGLPRKFPKQPGDNVRLLSYSPDKMVYEASTANGGFAVFSEVFYLLKNGSGWHAYVNGEERDILKVNYTLRGMELPAGTHEIVFEFNKDKLLQYNKIRGIFSIVTILVLLGLFGWWIALQVRPRPEA